MYFSAAASSEKRPREHELGLKHCPGRFNPAVQCGRHPAQHRVPNASLDVGEHLASIGLIPAPVQVLSRNAKLDNEIARQVFRLDFAALLPPKSEEGSLIVAHDGTGIRSAYKIAAIRSVEFEFPETV